MFLSARSLSVVREGGTVHHDASLSASLPVLTDENKGENREENRRGCSAAKGDNDRMGTEPTVDD